MLAIMGAMDEEITALLEQLQQRQDQPVLGGILHHGQLAGLEVILCKCGIGKVNAALSSAAIVAAGATRLIFTGVAGAIQSNLKVGDMVISSDLVQADVDVSALDYAVGTIPGEQDSWPADPDLQQIALATAAQITQGSQVVSGRIASGDQFVASLEGVERIREQFGAACVEMEGAAVAQVCHKAHLPFVVIRSISDTADHSASVNYQEFMPQMGQRAARVVEQMLLTMAAS